MTRQDECEYQGPFDINENEAGMGSPKIWWKQAGEDGVRWLGYLISSKPVVEVWHFLSTSFFFLGGLGWSPCLHHDVLWCMMVVEIIGVRWVADSRFYILYTTLDPKTQKNEGFKPPIYGL